MLVGIAAFFSFAFKLLGGCAKGDGDGRSKAYGQARVALGRHGWVGGTRCKYVHVSSCVAIHGNTRSRQPTRAYPLTGGWCATKEPALSTAVALACLARLACFACVGLPGSLAWLAYVTYTAQIAQLCSALLGSSFASPWPPTNCRGRGVCGLAGPLCRMDAAHEPPWMGLRRVPRTHTPHAWPSHKTDIALLALSSYRCTRQSHRPTVGRYPALADGDQNSAATVMNS